MQKLEIPPTVQILAKQELGCSVLVTPNLFVLLVKTRQLKRKD